MLPLLRCLVWQLLKRLFSASLSARAEYIILQWVTEVLRLTFRPNSARLRYASRTGSLWERMNDMQKPPLLKSHKYGEGQDCRLVRPCCNMSLLHNVNWYFRLISITALPAVRCRHIISHTASFRAIICQAISSYPAACGSPDAWFSSKYAHLSLLRTYLIWEPQSYYWYL